MRKLSRREAIAIASRTVAGITILGACTGEDGQSGEREAPPTPKEATIERVTPLFVVDIAAGTTASVWSGPGRATLHARVETTGASAQASYRDARSDQLGPVAEAPDPVPPNSRQTVVMAVPAGQVLQYSCRGSGNGVCRVVVTAIELPVPAGVTMGTPKMMPSARPDSVTVDPPMGQQPLPVGRIVGLRCGSTALLWRGRPSYVTVAMHATPRCVGTLDVLNGASTASERIDGNVLRSYGPVTELRAGCVGSSATDATCRFQVVDVLQLP
jgi:hypothetical protein